MVDQDLIDFTEREITSYVIYILRTWKFMAKSVVEKLSN